jgi:hypothetical protein
MTDNTCRISGTSVWVFSIAILIYFVSEYKKKAPGAKSCIHAEYYSRPVSKPMSITFKCKMTIKFKNNFVYRIIFMQTGLYGLHENRSTDCYIYSLKRYERQHFHCWSFSSGYRWKQPRTTTYLTIVLDAKFNSYLKKMKKTSIDSRCDRKNIQMIVDIFVFSYMAFVLFRI